MRRGLASYHEPNDDNDEPTEKRLPSVVLAMQAPDPSIDIEFADDLAAPPPFHHSGEPVSGIVRSSKQHAAMAAALLIPIPPPVEQRRSGLLIALVAFVGFALLAVGILLNTKALP